MRSGHCGTCGTVPIGDDSADGAFGWYCPICREKFEMIECKNCRRMVTETWYGLCSAPGTCSPAAPSPSEIEAAKAGLDQILSS